jgi:hypothetical protein
MPLELKVDYCMFFRLSHVSGKKYLSGQKLVKLNTHYNTSLNLHVSLLRLLFLVLVSAYLVNSMLNAGAN